MRLFDEIINEEMQLSLAGVLLQKLGYTDMEKFAKDHTEKFKMLAKKQGYAKYSAFWFEELFDKNGKKELYFFLFGGTGLAKFVIKNTTSTEFEDNIEIVSTKRTYR